MYHQEKYPEEDAKVTVLNSRDQDRITVVEALVEHQEHGKVKVAYGFPDDSVWEEELNGTKKYILKLKDKGLDELMPNTQHNPASSMKKDEGKTREV